MSSRKAPLSFIGQGGSTLILPRRPCKTPTATVEQDHAACPTQPPVPSGLGGQKSTLGAGLGLALSGLQKCSWLLAATLASVALSATWASLGAESTLSLVRKSGPQIQMDVFSHCGLCLRDCGLLHRAGMRSLRQTRPHPILPITLYPLPCILLPQPGYAEGDLSLRERHPKVLELVQTLLDFTQALSGDRN